MRLLGIDPGTIHSAFVDILDGRPMAIGFETNEDLLDYIETLAGDPAGLFDQLVIEWVSFYGKEIHAGSETFHTCRWVGRFQQAWNDDASCTLLERRVVRSVLCGTSRAGDAEVRAVLIDRYGGKEKAIGRKASPGPLYGISSHIWSALAVAVTFADQQRERKTA